VFSFILSVHPSSIRVYADGVEQDKFGFPRSRQSDGGASITNPAYPNPAKLSEQLGAITLAGEAAIGNFQSPLPYPIGFSGRMAWVQIFTAALSEEDSTCLFGVTAGDGCPAEAPEAAAAQQHRAHTARVGVGEL